MTRTPRPAPDATRARPAERRPAYEPPRILRKRAVIDATLQYTSTHNPTDPGNPFGGQ